ncbi:sprT-like domain-containing protein Spartan [Bradysia coprophila]|uniref:sprT-like domain-containing protein Spartan n=1 Tax=Bradysia coprophila TaxID=38358 RepID=UPI00187D85B9|nr:sprT-like domain-containing protein Spartan [Bradysia coprophila]
MITRSKLKQETVGENLELTDPTPDIQDLFKSLDAKFFDGVLSKNGIQLEWSKSIGLYDAGHCVCVKENLIKISLNERLLKYRTRKNLVETLLHEMIHASLFLDQDPDSSEHGPSFIKIMNRIYRQTGADVSVYHDYHNEIALYENRLWRCNGKKCENRPPHFGLMRVNPGGTFDFDDAYLYHLKYCKRDLELVKCGEKL